MTGAQLVAFPSFAPLSSSQVFRFVEEQDRYDFPPPDAVSSADPVRVIPFFEAERAHLAQRAQEVHPTLWTVEERNGFIAALLLPVQQKRIDTYSLMNPFAGELSTDWLLKALANTRHTVTPTTLTRWRDAGLLLYESKDRPDTNSVASLLIAASLHKQRRGFLPSSLRAGEPAWWCWRQDGPSAPVVPCPVPLPDDLPGSTLLWTQWTGAAWQREWLPVGRRGAIRWAGTMELHGKRLWDVSFDRLIEWVPEIASNVQELEVTAEELKNTPEILHTLANMALLHLARTCLRTIPLQHLSTG